MKKLMGILTFFLALTIFCFPVEAQEPQESSDWTVIPKGLGAQSVGDPYFIGHVVVGIIFPDSEGEGTTEKWTMDEIAACWSEVRASTMWWASLKQDLSFSYEHIRVVTSYEPITMSIWDYDLWIDDVLGTLGYESIPAYNEALALRHDADWGITVFVVDSSNDPDGVWPEPEAYYMIADECGQWLAITSDAGAYTTGHLDMAMAPGVGCAFCALPQFEAAQIPCARTSGIYDVETQNSEWGNCLMDSPSIMKYPWLAWDPPLVDVYAQGQLGWWRSVYLPIIMK